MIEAPDDWTPPPRRGPWAPTIAEADSRLYRHAYCEGRTNGMLKATGFWFLLGAAFGLGWWLA